MRVLMTTGNAYLPQQSGGAQSSTDQLAARLLREGHSVAALCRLQGGGWTEWRSRIERKLTGRRYSCDRQLGYPVYRVWDPTETREVVQSFQPDVAVVQSGRVMGIAKSLEQQGIPLVLYFRNVEFEELGGDPSSLDNALFISNSEFTGRKYAEAFGVDSTVIPPMIDPSLYRVDSTRKVVTMINPYPIKGGSLALEIAALCPDIPFVLVESWSLSPEVRAEIEPTIAALQNVTLMARTNDMKEVYGRTAVLLAPSQWEEAWGRIASEAHCSGIPVLGSNRGGLPEAIGPGGVILPHDAPASDWAAALRRMWDDPQEYARLSRAAGEYADRPELDAQRQFAMFLDVLTKAAESSGRASA